MKIRIQDNSIRFRITLKELEQLNQEGDVVAETVIRDPRTGMVEGRFQYGLVRQNAESESRCEIGPAAIFIHLNPASLAALNDPREEGIYLRREAQMPDGSVYRFLAFVEKDRPPSKCDKPERWIYEQHHGADDETRPMGTNAGLESTRTT
ncbi:MAG TPA: hypothetical protein PK360_16910 [bacterium]|nr:hypothetical protein [bacterium]